MTLTLTQWPAYMSLTHICWRYPTDQKWTFCVKALENTTDVQRYTYMQPPKLLPCCFTGDKNGPFLAHLVDTTQDRILHLHRTDIENKENLAAPANNAVLSQFSVRFVYLAHTVKCGYVLLCVLRWWHLVCFIVLCMWICTVTSVLCVLFSVTRLPCVSLHLYIQKLYNYLCGNCSVLYVWYSCPKEHIPPISPCWFL